jgi:thiol-disulfide isomerase/thioredoxin
MKDKPKHEVKTIEPIKQTKTDQTWKIISAILAFLLLLSIFTGGFGNCPGQQNNPNSNSGSIIPNVKPGSTFTADSNAEICKENSKPVIRLFSTTLCPHCQWIKTTFDKVAKEYVRVGALSTI